MSQTFPDGDTVEDWNRVHYWLYNCGVSFDPTDTKSSHPGFVSQTFVDGNVTEDWDRYLYHLYTAILADPVAFGTVVANEGFAGEGRQANKFVKDPAPPGQKL